nr:hypothetical protein [Tanacetum cinerariifolium]
MYIFAFIHTSDPTKVRIIERERNKGEARLLDTTVGFIVSLLPVAPDRADSELEASVERLFDEGGSGDQTEQGDSARGELNANIQLVVEAADIVVENRLLVGAVLNAEVRVAAMPTLPFVAASVSTTPKCEGGDHVDFETKPNLRTIGASRRFFISLDSSHHSGTNVAEAEVDSLVAKEKLVESSPFGAGSSLAGGTDPTTGVFLDLNGSDFLVAAIYTVRMRAKYNVKEKKRLKFVVERQDKLLKVREEEIESLKARLLLREAEAAEANRLCAKVSNFETVEKSPRDEMNALRERNVILKKERNALDLKVTELETSAMSKECELTDLNALLEEFQDDWMKVVNDEFDKLYADFVEMAIHLEEKLYPHLLTTISGRRWLLTHGIKLAIANCLNSPEYLSALGAAIGKAIEKGMQDGLAVGITHGKEGRVLTDVAVYIPSSEVDYISALQQLQNVNLSLAARLKSNKDASVETVMDILHLEGPLAEKLELNELQTHVDQLMVPIHSSPNKVVVALQDVFVPLAKPLSAAVLTGTEGTPDTVAATTDITTTQSITFSSASTIAPIFVDDYEVMGEDDQAAADENVASFPNVDDAELNIP